MARARSSTWDTLDGVTYDFADATATTARGRRRSLRRIDASLIEFDRKTGDWDATTIEHSSDFKEFAHAMYVRRGELEANPV